MINANKHSFFAQDHHRCYLIVVLDLASRMTLVKLFPFRFTEFILSSTWLIDSKNLIFPSKGLGTSLKETLFFSKNIKELKDKIEINAQDIKNYFEKISQIVLKNDLQKLVEEYISYHNIARFLPLKNKEIINERVIALFERILYKDLSTIDDTISSEVLFRLLMRLALSDEVNFSTLSRDFGKKENIEHFIDSLNKAEILNVFYPYGGIKSKTNFNIKPFFMSPSLRRALYTRVYGNDLNNSLRSKLYEDIVVMYLSKTFDKGLLSVGSNDNGVKPDFIIETLEKPIVLELGINKTRKRQITKLELKKRYGIIVNSKINNFSIDDDILFLPLHWFLLL